jgi:hypothetical protein
MSTCGLRYSRNNCMIIGEAAVANIIVLCLICWGKKFNIFYTHGEHVKHFILQSVHLLYIYAIRVNFCFIRCFAAIQMNFIFNDNVRILCLSCNVKNVGKLVRFKQKGQKQASFICCTYMLYE